MREKDKYELFCTDIEEEECTYFINRYDYIRYVPFRELDYIKKFNVYKTALNPTESQILLDTFERLLTLTETYGPICDNIFKQYLCFLSLNYCRNLLYTFKKQKPLFINSFWEQSYKRSRVEELIKQTLLLNRQVFIFSDNNLIIK